MNQKTEELRNKGKKCLATCLFRGVDASVHKRVESSSEMVSATTVSQGPSSLCFIISSDKLAPAAQKTIEGIENFCILGIFAGGLKYLHSTQPVCLGLSIVAVPRCP